jgi:hypothetical protein
MYHMDRLWDFFKQANKAAAVHSEAAWQYPMHLAHWLHENLDNNPEKSTADIVVKKFKHLHLTESKKEYIATSDPDVISFTPIVDSSTYSHGLGTHKWCFKVEHHSSSPSPLGTPRIHLVTPVPRSPSYHVRSNSPSPEPTSLEARFRPQSPPILVDEADGTITAENLTYVHPGPPYVKNRSSGRLCITNPITDALGKRSKAKYVQFVLDHDSPHAVTVPVDCASR